MLKSRLQSRNSKLGKSKGSCMDRKRLMQISSRTKLLKEHVLQQLNVAEKQGKRLLRQRDV